MNLIEGYKRENRRQHLRDRWAYLTGPMSTAIQKAMTEAATTGEELPTHMDIKTARGMVTIVFPPCSATLQEVKDDER